MAVLQTNSTIFQLYSENQTWVYVASNVTVAEWSLEMLHMSLYDNVRVTILENYFSVL